jgi:hypothetical protein
VKSANDLISRFNGLQKTVETVPWLWAVSFSTLLKQGVNEMGAFS